MFVRFECPGCHAVLRFDPSTVRPHDVCPKCGVEIDVAAVRQASTPPAPPAPPASPTLESATPQEMVEELSRRQKAAVLVYFDPPESGSFTLDDLKAAQMQCVRSGNIDEQQLVQLFGALGKYSELQKKTGIELSTDESAKPYEFKGDRLGCTLFEFREKHARQIPGCDQRLPWCSDEAGEHSSEELLVEPWHATAGIIHARLELPFESSPTIAGMETQRMLYQFVDERLFRISAWFNTEHFPTICKVLIGKYGPPTSEGNDPRQLIWENRWSSIVMTMAIIRSKKPSAVFFTHTELSEEAHQRQPNFADDV